MQVGEVAASAAGDEDLLADAVGALQDGNPASALAGFDGAHQPGSACAQDQHIIGAMGGGQGLSFGGWVEVVKSEGVKSLDQNHREVTNL